MIQIPYSVQIPNLPYTGLREVADVLYYEGPRIVHYKDELNNDFIYQWVDEDECSNRWLIYRTTESAIIDYVTGIGTVQQMLPSDLDYMVVLDMKYNHENDKHEIAQVLLIQTILLPEDYKPLPDAYYRLPVPDYYENVISDRKSLTQQQTEEQAQENVLGQKAFYLNLAPTKKKNGTNITLSQITKAGKEIQSSYNSYYAIAFENTFGVAPAKRKAELVAVDAGKGSFGIALASEFLESASNANSDIYEFNKDAALQFRKDVLEVDLSSADGLRELEAKFSPTEIKSIFTPIIKLVNDKKITVSLADESFLPKRKLKRVSTETAARIVHPILTKPTDEEEEKEIVTLVFEKAKSEDISRLTGKKMLDRTLYTIPTTALPFSLSAIQGEGGFLQFKSPVQVNLDFTDQRYIATYPPLGLEYTNSNYQEVTEGIVNKIVEYYSYLNKLTPDTRTETEQHHWEHYASLIE